ncbi:MAG TPA: hypothetical protein VHA33_15485 [Candidatus Angelobacter sp.]|jgi:hypothetical protein|nr:hypothetical protein [Candidatus Angelobacter sp.]
MATHIDHASSFRGWLLLASTIAVTVLLAPAIHAAACQSCGDGGGVASCNNVGGNGVNPNDGGAGNDGCPPIVIDVSGRRFKLTNAARGVRFDIAGTGKSVQIAWTAPDTGMHFLYWTGIIWSNRLSL